MGTIFIKVLNMSIIAGWLVLAIVLLHAFFRKIPKWIMCALWALVAVRLLFPLPFESRFSLVPSVETVPQDIIYSEEPAIHTGIPAANAVINPVLSDMFAPANDGAISNTPETDMELTPETDVKLTPEAAVDMGVTYSPIKYWTDIMGIVWVAGIGAMLMFALFSYLKMRRKTAASILYDYIGADGKSTCNALSTYAGTENNTVESSSKKSGTPVYECDDIDSPFILGLIAPKIYVPSGMDAETLKSVCSHESAHLRRRDYIWKPLGFMLLSVYWFNPLMWVAYILLSGDIEAACDEKVIENMDRSERAAYSQALLNCGKHERRFSVCPLSFGETGVKGRVKSILNYKKPAFWIMIVALAACVIVGICFLTNPKAKGDSEGNDMSGIEALIRDYDNDKNSILELDRTELQKLYGEPTSELNGLLGGEVYQTESGEGLMVYYDNESQKVSNIDRYTTVSIVKAPSYEEDKEIGGKIYVCTDTTVVKEQRAFNNFFHLSLYSDGTISYTQPIYSSYLPMGKWYIEGNTLVIKEDMFTNYFDIVDGNLVYREDGSSGFMFYDIPDGTVFERKYLAPEKTHEYEPAVTIGDDGKNVETTEDNDDLYEKVAGKVFWCTDERLEQNNWSNTLVLKFYKDGTASYNTPFYSSVLPGNNWYIDGDQVVFYGLKFKYVDGNLIKSGPGALRYFNVLGDMVFSFKEDLTEPTSGLPGSTQYSQLFFDYRENPSNIIGMNYKAVIEKYGEPSGSLSGFWGDIYDNGMGESLILYYDRKTECVIEIHSKKDTNNSGQYVYKRVLSGKEKFYYCRDGEQKELTIDDVPELFTPGNPDTYIAYYTFCDLDRSGASEAILDVISTGDGGGKLILHRMNGLVYAYKADQKRFLKLKTDGTYMYGGYGGGIEDGYARIFGFTESGFTEEKISYLHNENGRYEIVMKDVPYTEEKLRNDAETHKYKTNSYWYEYNKDYFLEAEPTQPPVALHN
ncbi:MAG: hypothetical protein IK014_00165 [Lachnospiraceae bacterium]|nr:hypothetical protein [Lachnospiraceae bacterium]